MGWKMIVVGALSNLLAKAAIAGILGGWQLLVRIVLLFSIPAARRRADARAAVNVATNLLSFSERVVILSAAKDLRNAGGESSLPAC